MLERQTGTLIYFPKPGEEPGRTQVIAPQTDQLLVLRGDPAAKRWVENIVFRRITFAHSNWVTPPEGNSFPQAEAKMAAAISATAARHCIFEQCDVVRVGGYAFEFGDYCRHNRVDDCELIDLGGGGIKIGSTTAPDLAAAKADSSAAGENVVRNCLIEGGGRLHPAAVGVWIGHSAQNTIEHNHIADFYYTGISLGWSWGYAPSNARDNIIASNRISNIGQKILSDMGGIYTLGNGPGNVLRNNIISDVESFDYGGWGIYFDEGSTAFVAENNLVYHVKSAGFHQHYGRENVVRNNIFALGRDAQLMRSRNEPHLSFTLERNIVYASGAPIFASQWDDKNFRLASNVYWNASGRPPLFPGKRSLEAWQKETGHDAGSIVADPLFENPANNDFRLKPGSPAKTIGFEPIDFSKVGRITTPRRSGAKPVPPGFRAE